MTEKGCLELKMAPCLLASAVVVAELYAAEPVFYALLSMMVLVYIYGKRLS